MKVVIAGGRDLQVPDSTITHAMEASGFRPLEIVSGACRGVDLCGERWAVANGLPIARFPYRRELGRAGGPVRNREMAEYGDALLAFPGAGDSRGTWNMIRCMIDTRKPVFVWSRALGRKLEPGEWPGRR